MLGDGLLGEEGLLGDALLCVGLLVNGLLG